MQATASGLKTGRQLEQHRMRRHKAVFGERHLPARQIQGDRFQIVLHQIAREQRVADLDVRPQATGQPGKDDGLRLPAIDQVLRHHRRHHLADAALADQHLLPFEPATMLGEAVPENLLAIFKPGQEFVDFAVHGAENNDHAGFPTDKRLIDQSDQSRY